MRKKLRIGSNNWTIEYVHDLVDESGQILYGDTDRDNRVIRINRSHTPKIQSQTLLHEILHAALHETGMAYVLANDALEEGLVRALEHTLWPLFNTLKT